MNSMVSATTLVVPTRIARLGPTPLGEVHRSGVDAESYKVSNGCWADLNSKVSLELVRFDARRAVQSRSMRAELTLQLFGCPLLMGRARRGLDG